MVIVLPFPPSALSGHQGGRWRAKADVVRKWRAWAFAAALEAKATVRHNGDIRVSVAFYPPDNRGDRVNFPNRCKPIFDGIADAMKVNDKRFAPSFSYHDPVKPGRVEIVIGGAE